MIRHLMRSPALAAAALAAALAGAVAPAAAQVQEEPRVAGSGAVSSIQVSSCIVPMVPGSAGRPSSPRCSTSSSFRAQAP